jgi:hypothetical protein
VNRPDDCRYAVAGSWDIAKHRENVLVWDLYNVNIGRGGKLLTPAPVRVLSDVDAAIMANTILYDQGDGK